MKKIRFEKLLAHRLETISEVLIQWIFNKIKKKNIATGENPEISQQVTKNCH